MFINFGDSLNRWKLDRIISISTKIKEYCDAYEIKDAELVSVEDNSWNDPANQRVDIEIRYVNEQGYLIQQKLLLMKGMLIDGNEFHKRFHEFYPEKEIV